MPQQSLSTPLDEKPLFEASLPRTSQDSQWSGLSLYGITHVEADLDCSLGWLRFPAFYRIGHKLDMNNPDPRCEPQISQPSQPPRQRPPTTAPTATNRCRSTRPLGSAATPTARLAPPPPALFPPLSDPAPLVHIGPSHSLTRQADSQADSTPAGRYGFQAALHAQVPP